MALERRLAEQLDHLAPLLADVPSLADDRLLDALTRLGAIRRLVDAMGVGLAGEVQRRCHEGALAARLGEKSAAAVVAAFTRIEPAEARAWCELGEAVISRRSLFHERLEPRRPVVAEFLARGEVGAMAVAKVSSAPGEVERRSPERVRASAELLAKHAPHLTGRELSAVCRRLVDSSDPDGVLPRESESRRRSGLEVMRTSDGMLRWVVTMHPEAAGFLTTALDARTAPRREPRFGQDDGDIEFAPEEADSRTLSHRRLDALISMARESLEHDSGRVAGIAVTMVVTIPLETLRSGIGAAQIEGIDTPISAATARRLAASAELIPAVLGGPSEPLDLGRAQRLFSAPQRRALAIRDGGCVWPRCEAPPAWCEVAHVDASAMGGPTDLANGALMCPYHHRRFDVDGWALEWRADQRVLVPPAWVDSSRRPRPIGRVSVAA
ncbi:MAG: DUF222 domain-containing protein [Acidobacteria bacterium]|nr:DUF222 domain-containing protein [Acidobacteriota bacterium]